MIYTDLQNSDPEIYKAIMGEEKRQSEGMELIASENYQSKAVLEAQASVLANKYAEGFPGKRYYGGQEFTDIVESLAIERAKQIFGSDHANVQPLSGAAANVSVYAGLMEPGDTILGMNLSHGGHLTHGSPVTFMSKVFNFINYKTLSNGEIDYVSLRNIALETKPRIILAGFSAYPREPDYAKFAEIAKETGSILMADMAHIAGFIAAGLLKNPLNYGFHVMTTTTHKSLRGPRGAMILSKGIVSNPLMKPENTIANIPTIIDRAVFPGVQGGPHENVIGAIAVALKEAMSDNFKAYAKQALLNAKTMAEEFKSKGYKLVTNGTDNHMMVLDFSEMGFGGLEVEKALDKIGISTSKSTIPDDKAPPFRPSGLRIGTPAMTTRGVKEDGIIKIVDFIDTAIKNMDNDKKLEETKKEVMNFCKDYPVPSI